MSSSLAAYLSNNYNSMLSVVVFFVVVILTRKLIHRPRRNLPPGPKGWPVIGNIPALKRSGKHIHKAFADWSRLYGNVMTVRVRPGFDSGMVVLSDVDAVREVLVTQANNFSSRYLMPLTIHLSSLKGSYLWESGEAAKDRRRFGNQAFRSLGVGKKKIEHKINEEIRYLSELFESKQGRPFKPDQLMHNAVANIICTLSFGDRMDYSDPKFTELLKTFKSVFDNAGFSTIGNAFPFLFYTPVYSQLRGWFKEIQNYMNQSLQEHNESYDPENMRDILDLYIHEGREQQERAAMKQLRHGEASFAENHVWRGMLDMFGAGMDTTTNTVLWLLLYVLVYPEIQEKIQREICDVIGEDRQPTWEDYTSMPYTNAVVMEVQRMRPVAAIAAPYKADRDVKLYGYDIPKGTGVFANLYAVLHDPNEWDSPEDFKPERFLSEDGKTLLTPKAFIPFSIGRRGCLGESLAKVELFLFTTNLMQRFTFKLPPNASCPSTAGIAGFTFAPVPFEICALSNAKIS